MIADKGVHSLPDGPISRQDFLKGRTAERAVRRNGQGKQQKLVVEPFDYEQVNFV